MTKAAAFSQEKMVHADTGATHRWHFLLGCMQQAELLYVYIVFYCQSPRSGSASRGTSILGNVPSSPVNFTENGVKFRADVVVGQKTGFFLDQRDNRKLMQVGPWVGYSLKDNSIICGSHCSFYTSL